MIPEENQAVLKALEKLEKANVVIDSFIGAIDNYIAVMEDTEEHKNEDGIEYEDFKLLKKAHDDALIFKGICPKCHQKFSAHNDDGSCIEDVLQVI